MVAHIDAPARTHTVRHLNFSDGFHWCEHCDEGASRKPAIYFVMTLERVEAETAEKSV